MIGMYGVLKIVRNAPGNMFDAAEVLGIFFYDIFFTFGRRGTRSFRNYIMMSFMHLGVSLLVGEDLAFASFLSSISNATLVVIFCSS